MKDLTPLTADSVSVAVRWRASVKEEMRKRKRDRRAVGVPLIPLARRNLDFSTLVSAIRRVHEQSAARAGRAVNVYLTIRNWLIGAYIREYEQHGADRAEYGARLLERLADALQQGLDRCYTGRYLGLCRQLFDVYPEIRKSLISEFPLAFTRGLPTNAGHTIRKSAISKLRPSPRQLVERLSFTHLVELITIEDPFKRAFYDVECIRGNWSVRQLKRQIAALYFERSGLSKNKEKLAAMVEAGAETVEPKLAIRDPYVFEFLGLRAKDAVAESDLEAALVENLRRAGGLLPGGLPPLASAALDQPRVGTGR